MGQSPKATGLEKVKSQLSSSIVSVGSTLSSLKAKAMGRRNGVNMNRGASPFRERIPQHSRNNSVLSTQSAVGGRERFGDWLGRVKSDLISGLGREKEVEVVDQFSVAREKGASTVPAPLNVGSNLDFSPLAAMEERQRQLAAEERERALASGSQAQNPFADPWPAPASQNPFGDPANVLAPPLPSQPSSSGYFADVFRAARQSNATTIDSRYPSTYAPSRDSYGYRDTYMSSTTNGRRTKGRSDPFDLEKLELDARPGAANQSYLGADRAPRVVSSASSVRSTGTYSSKYTSGVVHEEWGDPGPDLGPGSNTTNSRTNPGPRAGGVLEEGTRGSQRSIGKAL